MPCQTRDTPGRLTFMNNTLAGGHIEQLLNLPQCFDRLFWLCLTDIFDQSLELGPRRFIAHTVAFTDFDTLDG